MGGAQGGTNVNGQTGGGGGYSVGLYRITTSQQLFVNVGGAGTASATNVINVVVPGTYNGGGKGKTYYYNSANGGSVYAQIQTASGGGASHIATVSGQLKSLSSYKDTGGANISKEILIVAGGGGGGHYHNSSNYGLGGYGGGFSGVKSSSEKAAKAIRSATPGTQTAGGCTTAGSYYCGCFGYGGNGDDNNNGGSSDGCLSGSGGGGGWYGGGSAGCAPGAGGSGYIGSSNLISGGGITKHMTCYSCTTSTADATRTISNTNVSSTATADYSKTGNGYARITYLGTSI